MVLWFPEIELDDIWTPIGPGYPTRDEAEMAVARWKQYMRCYGDECFRYRPHQLAEPAHVSEEMPW